MQQSNQFFATARPWRLFLIVALPGMVSMLAAALYNAMEGSFVGHLLGEAAFAAINIAMPVVMINFALADLIGVGAAVPISVSLGRGDRDRANNIFTSALLMIVGTGLFMGILLYMAAPFFTRLMGAEGDLAALAVRYVRVYAIFSPLTTVVFATDNFLRISGFVKGSMLLNILMTALTVGFLLLFLGVLQFDVRGSALSACLSMLICAVIALIPFLRGRAVLRFVRPRFSLSMIREIISCGMPVFLNNIAGRITSILMNSALLRLGGQTAVAVYAVLMYSGGVIEPMLYGLCDSIQPAVGYNWGAKRPDRVRDITKCSLTVCALVSVLCTAVMILFPQLFVALFIDPADTALVELSSHALRLFGTAFLIGWFSFAIQGFFAAIEKPLPATILSVAKALVFPVLFLYALEHLGLGLDGLWLNYTCTSVCTAILAILLVLPTQKRIQKDLPSAEAPLEDT